MNFKAYDILTSLIPGFLALLAGMQLFEIPFNKDLIVPYTAEAFLLGYVMAALSSWFEGIYYLTWGGKPSTRLLEGKNIWKVKFYASDKVKNLLKEECSSRTPSMDELFSCAVRKTNGGNNTKIEDFNAHYAFSRSLLTTALFGVPFVLYQHSCDYRFYIILLPLLFIIWLRAKQRAYFYAREVLSEYLKIKQQ